MVLCLGAHFDELQLYIQNLRGKRIKKHIVQSRHVFDLDVGLQMLQMSVLKLWLCLPLVVRLFIE